MTRVSLGPLADLPTAPCVAVCDGRAVAFRTGTEVRVFANRCPHEGQPLAGGWVADGVLVCPAHFWRFDATTGHLVGSSSIGLEPLPVDVVDGEVLVELPPEQRRRSIRDELLDHARTWSRGDEQ